LSFFLSYDRALHLSKHTQYMCRMRSIYVECVLSMSYDRALHLSKHTQARACVCLCAACRVEQWLFFVGVHTRGRICSLDVKCVFCCLCASCLFDSFLYVRPRTCLCVCVSGLHCSWTSPRMMFVHTCLCVCMSEASHSLFWERERERTHCSWASSCTLMNVS